MPVRAVCFDLFHTLVDVASVPDAVGAFTADILGVGRADWNAACFSDQHEIRRETRHEEVIRDLARGLDPDIPEERILHATRERQARFDHALRRIEPGILAVLDEIRARGLATALISNASTGEVSAWGSSPLASRMDVAVFSCECGYAKAEQAIYLHALEKLGMGPEECLYVGDGGSREHEGAAALGMHTVLLTRYVLGHLPASDLASRRQAARHECHDLAGILALLGENG